MIGPHFCQCKVDAAAYVVDAVRQFCPQLGFRVFLGSQERQGCIRCVFLCKTLPMSCSVPTRRRVVCWVGGWTAHHRAAGSAVAQQLVLAAVRAKLPAAMQAANGHCQFAAFLAGISSWREVAICATLACFRAVADSAPSWHCSTVWQVCKVAWGVWHRAFCMHELLRASKCSRIGLNSLLPLYP